MGSVMRNQILERQQSNDDQGQGSHPEEPLQELLNRLGKESRTDLMNGSQHVLRVTMPPIIISRPSFLNFTALALDEITTSATETPLPLPNLDAIDSCDCASCSNKRSTSELINQFETHKVRMITELDDLKSDSNQLEDQASQLTSRIAAYSKLANARHDFVAELQGGSNSSNNAPAIIPIPNLDELLPKQQQNLGAGDFCPGERTRSQSLRNDIRTLQAYRNVLNKRLTNKSGVRPPPPPPCSTELVKEKENIANDRKDIEVELEKALGNNLYMVGKIKHLETIVQTLLGNGNDGAHHQTIPNGRSHSGGVDLMTATIRNCLSDESCAMNKLELMKQAYDTNQNLINVLNEQLQSKNLLISKYEEFTRDLYNCIGGAVPVSNVTAPENADVSQTLDHLWVSLRHVLTDSGMLGKKLEALQNVLTSANRENALLNETVSSLNEHMEELSQENDKLMRQFQFNHENCNNCSSQFSEAFSSCSTPRTEYTGSEAATIEDRINNNDGYPHSFSFDFDLLPPPPMHYSSGRPDSPSSMSSMSTIREVKVPPPTPSYEGAFMSEAGGIGNTTSIVNNLKLATSVLQDLKNSSLIFSPM